MKNIIVLLTILSSGISLIAQSEIDNSPEILVEANTTYAYIEDLTLPLTFGIATEAKINKHFSISGNFTYGSDDRINRLFINPDIRFYPMRTFKGFFLKAGLAYHQIGTDDDLVFLPYPFDSGDIVVANFLTLNAGLGFRTVVKDKITIGFSLALAAPFDDDIDTVMVESGFSVGYGF